MRRIQITILALSLATACGSSSSTESGGHSTTETSGSEEGGGGGGGGGGGENGEFQLNSSDSAEQAHGDHPSEITATATHAAMRLFVVDPDAGPIPGIVIKMTGPDGISHYTHPTDSVGYAEVLVPVGVRYEVEYLALGRRNATAHVQVPAGPNQDIRLTMRHRPRPAPAPAPNAAPDAEPPGLVLEGLTFGNNSATIEEASHERLDRVVEYMTHMDTTRIRIAGYTDNVGNRQRNRALSLSRAQAVREYLVTHGIDGARVEAVGLGDESPVASNDTEEGRAQNRRIEATEL